MTIKTVSFTPGIITYLEPNTKSAVKIGTELSIGSEGRVIKARTKKEIFAVALSDGSGLYGKRKVLCKIL